MGRLLVHQVGLVSLKLWWAMQIVLLCVTLVEDIVNGDLDESARKLLLSSSLIASEKDSGGVRPIAIGDVFYLWPVIMFFTWFNQWRRLFSNLFSLLSLMVVARELSIFCRRH